MERIKEGISLNPNRELLVSFAYVTKAKAILEQFIIIKKNGRLKHLLLFSCVL